VGASLNYDDDSISVDYKEGVNEDEDNDYHNNYDDDDNNNKEEEEAAAAVRNNKRRHGRMEEEGEGGGGGGEEDNDEEVVVVMWLSVKVMSKMSDGEFLCTHFNTELQKNGSSICRNRQCNCLTILRNGNACLSIARFMTWFTRQTQY
jgi:hypothetical protein